MGKNASSVKKHYSSKHVGAGAGAHSSRGLHIITPAHDGHLYIIDAVKGKAIQLYFIASPFHSIQLMSTILYYILYTKLYTLYTHYIFSKAVPNAWI